MSDAAAPRDAQPDAANRVGSAAAPGSARWLSLAAAPTFALMAIGTALVGGEAELVCMPMRVGAPINGMTAMYLLMSVFHLVPWLRRWPARARHIADSDDEPLAAWDSEGKEIPP